ncbi:MAG: hypothetical protein GWM91_15890, partial [Actinobacteria bacterium]|nr:hypothetical protein [Actinomycetota bacterium]NIV88505.1 hypothetical protein [Actinomycetota bacterium]NIX51792.1 hypothetical protein [Actinomycetota bacterium]
MAPTTFLSNLPTHALGVFERATALAYPGVTGWWIWLLGALTAPVALLGLVRLVQQLPPLGWFGVA